MYESQLVTELPLESMERNKYYYWVIHSAYLDTSLRVM